MLPSVQSRGRAHASLSYHSICKRSGAGGIATERAQPLAGGVEPRRRSRECFSRPGTRRDVRTTLHTQRERGREPRASRPLVRHAALSLRTGVRVLFTLYPRSPMSRRRISDRAIELFLPTRPGRAVRPSRTRSRPGCLYAGSAGRFHASAWLTEVWISGPPTPAGADLAVPQGPAGEAGGEHPLPEPIRGPSPGPAFAMA